MVSISLLLVMRLHPLDVLCHFQVRDIFVEVFRLKDSSLTLPFMETLLGSREFRDVATLAISLGIREKMPVEKISKALYLSGNQALAES